MSVAVRESELLAANTVLEILVHCINMLSAVVH